MRCFLSLPPVALVPPVRAASHVIVLAASLGLPGCLALTPSTPAPTSPPSPPDGLCAEDVSPCRRNIDCGAGMLCTPAEIGGAGGWGCCERVFCVEDTDCGASEECHRSLGLCLPADLCEPGRGGEGCEPDEYCLYVDDGTPRCASEEELPTAIGCELEPSHLVVAAGETVPLRGSGLSLSGGLAPYARVELASDVGDVVDGRFIGRCTDGEVCQGHIVGSAGGEPCETPVWVFVPPPVGSRRAIVVDDRGAPVAGASVTWRLSGGEGVTEVTGDEGSARVTASGEALAVTVRAEGWRTRTLLQPGTDVLLALEPASPPTFVAAGRTNPQSIDYAGDLTVIAAGLSHAGPAFTLSHRDVLGPPSPLLVDLFGVTSGPQPTVVPGGMALRLGATELKERWLSYGRDQTHVAWTLATKRRLADALEVVRSLSEGGRPDLSLALAGLLSAASHGVDLTVRPVAHEPPDGERLGSGDTLRPGDYPGEEDDLHLYAQLIGFQETSARLPALPCSAARLDDDGACTDRSSAATGAMLLVVADVPRRGQVPLGLTAGWDDPLGPTGSTFDGVIDSGGAERGQLDLRYSPLHDGLEGQPLLAVALATKPHGPDGWAETVATVVQPMPESTALEQVEVAFLPLPAGAFRTEGTQLAWAPVPGADLLEARLLVAGEAWDLWVPPGVGTVELATLRPGLSGAPISLVELRAYAFVDGEEHTFDTIAHLSGRNLDGLAPVVAAFSRMPCDAPGPWQSSTPGCVARDE